MEQENADVQTVTGVSASPSIGSFGRFGRNLGITIARDAKSLSWNRPSFSSQKKSDRKSRHQEVGEWSLDECRHSIMELAKELNRVLKNTAIPTLESSEEMCSLEDCRCFMKKWADELDKLYPNLKQNRSLGQVERSEGADLRTNEGEEHRLKIAYYIMREWPWKLKTESENSVSAGEDVEQRLSELVQEWKRGQLKNILPIMEFVLACLRASYAVT